MSYSNSSAKNEYTKGFKNGSQFVKLEDFKPFNIYAITYSPSNEPSDCSDRSLSTYHNLELNSWKEIKGIAYYLLPEFGEQNRLHYHGLISFRTGMDYIRFKHHFKDVHIVIKKIFNHRGWLYFTKQNKHLRKTFFLDFGDKQMLTDWYEHYIFRALPDLTVLQDI